MSQIGRSIEWLRSQWNSGGGGKRFAIIFALLMLWPFALIYGLVALVFEIIASLDRAGRFSTKAHWAIAALLVVGGLTLVSAISPSAEPTIGAEAAVQASHEPIETTESTALPSDAPSAAPIATADAPSPTSAPDVTEAPTPAPSIDSWSRDTAVTLMEAEGFSGEESPLLDGTPRWLGRDSSSSMAEVIGSDRASTVSLTVQANEANGEMIGRMLNTWCPSGTDWVVSTIGGYSGTDLDEAETFSDCSVHVQTMAASDGALVIVSIDG